MYILQTYIKKYAKIRDDFFSKLFFLLQNYERRRQKCRFTAVRNTSSRRNPTQEIQTRTQKRL